MAEQRIEIRKIHPLFGAEVTGVDLRTHLTGEDFAEILSAFDQYSILVFRGQNLSADQHIAFSKRFGALEILQTGLPGKKNGGGDRIWISNVDPETDAIFAPDHPAMLRQISNELWHTDSSFKQIGAKASLLHARQVPPVGGDTNFVSTRVAFNRLPPERQEALEKMAVEHDFIYSRSLTVKEDFLSAKQKSEVPPVPQSLVVKNPRTGAKALYLGSHASRIMGWPTERGRALLKELTELATQEHCIYRHQWKPHDLIIWDNQSTLHRGGGYDHRRYRRVMIRTTVAGDAPTISAEEAAARAANTAAAA